MIQIPAHIISLALSLCSHSYLISFLNLTLLFHLESLFLCLTYFSACFFSLFPFPSFLVLSLFPGLDMDGSSHAHITLWCQYFSSLPFVMFLWLCKCLYLCLWSCVCVFSHSERFLCVVHTGVSPALSIITAFALIE